MRRGGVERHAIARVGVGCVLGRASFPRDEQRAHTRERPVVLQRYGRNRKRMEVRQTTYPLGEEDAALARGALDRGLDKRVSSEGKHLRGLWEGKRKREREGASGPRQGWGGERGWASR